MINFGQQNQSLKKSKEEGLECPICWTAFNVDDNVPFVLWCGHSLCKTCVLGLQRAVLKLPALPIQLPFFVSCPWCKLLSLRLHHKGNLKLPRKNYFLLWMVESSTGGRSRTRHSSVSYDQNDANRVIDQEETSLPTTTCYSEQYCFVRKSLVLFLQMTARFPFLMIWILIVLYAVVAAAAILSSCIFFAVLLALSSFSMLYFSYPSLDWVVREISNIA